MLSLLADSSISEIIGTVPNDQCATTKIPWSIITSAGTNSTLAGVLGGFMITAITVLFLTKGRSELVGQSIALFAAGVVILGLDSYLFSMITGSQLNTFDEAIENIGNVSIIENVENVENVDPQIIEQLRVLAEQKREVCQKIWAQGLYASGMLAVGGTALAAGIGWLLATFATSKQSKKVGSSYPRRLTATGKSLVEVGACIIGVTLVTATILLGKRIDDYFNYLSLMGGNRAPPGWVRWPGLVAAGAMTIAACGSTLWVRTKRFKKKFDFRKPKDVHAGRMKPTVLSILILAFASSLLAAISTTQSLSLLQPSWGIILLFGYLFPLGIFAAICLSGPSVKP